MFHGIVRWFPVLSVVEGFADGGAVEADDGEVPANLRWTLVIVIFLIYFQ